MLDTKEIQYVFSSLMEFEQFRLEWIRACAKLYKESINAELLPEAERRARCMGIVK